MPIENMRHANISTAEVCDFVPNDAKAQNVVRHPRDPSLDPQLALAGERVQVPAGTAPAEERP